jgi:transcriptional regulator with XRE-family HTH domain
MTLSDRFKIITEEIGKKQKEIASELGITESYISRLISGAHENISLSLALLIQEKYYYSAQWVMTGEGDKFVSSKNSIVKQKAINAVEKLSSSELKAVMAFVNSLDDVRRIFAINSPDKKINNNVVAAHNDDTSDEELERMNQDVDEL